VDTSPSKFVTGRPIDQGANATKLKKLERSLSGKVTYEQLVDQKGNLPPYLETIETIFDVTMLEKMVSRLRLLVLSYFLYRLEILAFFSFNR
jgi:hypothetical protein